VVDLSADLPSIAAEALVAVARRLREGGENDYARNLVQQAADIELLSSEIQNCWGGPFNGQEGRLAIIQELLEAVVPAAVVETGTYRGISTHWLAQHFAGPIWSCEAEDLYFLQAERRLKGCRSVFLELSDSRPFLKRLVLTLTPDHPTFFYLDAHWKQDLPLRDELAIIFASQPKAVVMVDDFRIPQDAGYQREWMQRRWKA
jgi:predicted O-methyltransferase YrrM